MDISDIKSAIGTEVIVGGNGALEKLYFTRSTICAEFSMPSLVLELYIVKRKNLMVYNNEFYKN